ncbi:hypothetical protein STEG23_022978, partial [Scotinomys teguina]
MSFHRNEEPSLITGEDSKATPVKGSFDSPGESQPKATNDKKQFLRLPASENSIQKVLKTETQGINAMQVADALRAPRCELEAFPGNLPAILPEKPVDQQSGFLQNTRTDPVPGPQGQARSSTPVIEAPSRLRQEDHEFNVSLNYTANRGQPGIRHQTLANLK